MKTLSIPFAAACAVLATPSVAQERQIGPDRYAAVVRHADPAHPQRTLARIDAAALAVCGAPAAGLREVTLAVRRSSCWRDAMNGAVAQLADRVPAGGWRQRAGK